MAYIHVYKSTPTVGGTDGIMVSEGLLPTAGGYNPISVGPLSANTNQESAPIKLAIRSTTGFKTFGNTTITPTGTTAAKWALSLDGTTWAAYGAALTVTAEITTVNTIFWVKAKATSDEAPSNDTSVDLKVDATIVAV